MFPVFFNLGRGYGISQFHWLDKSQRWRWYVMVVEYIYLHNGKLQGVFVPKERTGGSTEVLHLPLPECWMLLTEFSESSWKETSLTLENMPWCQFSRSSVQKKWKCKFSATLIINYITHSLHLKWIAENAALYKKLKLLQLVWRNKNQSNCLQNRD